MALQVHGAIVADNGSGWYSPGVPDARWDNDALRSLGAIKGADFQAVDAVRSAGVPHLRPGPAG